MIFYRLISSTNLFSSAVFFSEGGGGRGVYLKYVSGALLLLMAEERKLLITIDELLCETLLHVYVFLQSAHPFLFYNLKVKFIDRKWKYEENYNRARKEIYFKTYTFNDYLFS